MASSGGQAEAKAARVSNINAHRAFWSIEVNVSPWWGEGSSALPSYTRSSWDALLTLAASYVPCHS